MEGDDRPCAYWKISVETHIHLPVSHTSFHANIDRSKRHLHERVGDMLYGPQLVKLDYMERPTLRKVMAVLQEAFRAHAGSESERTMCCSVTTGYLNKALYLGFPRAGGF